MFFFQKCMAPKSCYYHHYYRIVRECCDDCVINGIQFIKGSKMQVPVQYLHYSTEYWEQPNEFRPER